MKISFKFLLLAFCLVLGPDAVPAQPRTIPTEELRSIEKNIEALRGMKFKHPVKAAPQSLQDFEQFVLKELEKQMDDDLSRNYGKIVRKLGLYRGPEIEDFREMFKTVYLSQAAAYYDPDARTFYVVRPNLPQEALVAVYSHELYHGFQDQHFDLRAYLNEEELSDDELLARQAVVEGEAHYVSSLLTIRHLFPGLQASNTVRTLVKLQSQMDVTQLAGMLKSSLDSQEQLSADMQAAIKALDTIPRFVLETLMGAYLKGMAFVFEIQTDGWSKVSELYRRPPVSTEQILHPDKWRQNERPQVFEWPPFSQEPLFSRWEVLESNTVGEFQWRIIFAEHGLDEEGRTAAAGWNGDRFAVLEHEERHDLLLLLYTSWDSEQDAEEFQAAYKKLLEVKYANEPDEAVALERTGTDVLVVEGGDSRALPDWVGFVKRIERVRE